MKAIKELKHGEYFNIAYNVAKLRFGELSKPFGTCTRLAVVFTLKEIEEPKENQVWVRDDYDPAEKEYICYNFADTSKWKYLKGDKKVFDSEHFCF